MVTSKSYAALSKASPEGYGEYGAYRMDTADVAVSLMMVRMQAHNEYGK